MLKSFVLSDTETGFIRAYCVDGKSLDQSVRSLTNWELADELGFWDHADKAESAPDWWHEMTRDARTTCLAEITRRSRKLNDLGGIDYIKVYNANNGITDILMQYGVAARAGKTTRCPMHDDSTPSLSVSRDNKRAFCFNQSCILWHEGFGVDPFELNKILRG